MGETTLRFLVNNEYPILGHDFAVQEETTQLSDVTNIPKFARHCLVKNKTVYFHILSSSLDSH